MAGLEDFGRGLQSAGEILSPQVYEKNAIERRDTLENVARSLQIQKAKRALDADTKFSDALSGMQPSAFKTSGDVMDALKGVPLDIIAESPRAQATLQMVGQMQQREAVQEQRVQQIQLRYDQMEQQRAQFERESSRKEASDLERARAHLAEEQLKAEMVKIKGALERLQEGKAGGGQGAPQRDYVGEYGKLDDAGKTALDMQAWNYINKNLLPYRKGTGGGADRNDPIIHRAGQIANELGMTAQELSGKSAEYKSYAQTLYGQTKKLNAIQGVLESFHNNIATWDSIAEGEVPKIGGSKLGEIRDKLRKIDFSSVKTLNDWEIKIRTQFNDPAMVAYVTGAFTVAMDYSRILSSQGQSAAAVTEGARDEALKLVAAGYNRDSRKALIGTLESEAIGQVKGLEKQTNRLRAKMGLRAEASTAEPDKPTGDGGGGGAKQDPLGIR